MVAPAKQQPLKIPEQQDRKAKEWTGAPRGYINADLSKQEKGDFREWAQQQEGGRSWTMLMEMCDDGYRISISQDATGFKVACTNISGPTLARGLCLSGYASDAATAALSLLYKHHVKLAGEWGEPSTDSGDYVR